MKNPASLKSQFINAAKWSIGSSLVIKFISFITTIILARILSPNEFGLFTLAFVVIDGFGLFKSLGFESALVQRKDEINKAANTAFVIIPAMGLIVYALLLISLPVLADIFKSSDLINVLKILGFIFVVNTLTRVPLSLLEKKLQFDKRARAEILSQLIYCVVSISFAVLSYGVWSLVYGYLAMSIVKGILVWHSAQWRPNYTFDRPIAIEMFHYGKFVFISCVMVFLVNNFDRVMVGKIVGIPALGMYAIAYNLVNIIGQYIGSKISVVLFPLYSKLNDNLYSLRHAYLRVLKNITLITLPVSVCLFLFGGEFLEFAFGEKWIGAIPILQILAAYGFFNLINMCNKSLFMGINHPKISMLTTSVQIILYVSFIFPAGKKMGIEGIAMVVVFSSLMSMLFGFINVFRLIEISMKELWDSLKLAVLASLMMSVIVYFTKLALAEVISSLIIELTILCILSVFAYCLIVIFYDREIINDMKKIFIKN